MRWKQRWIKAELVGILILCVGKILCEGREGGQGVERSLEQYRNPGQYWSLGTDTETGEAERVGRMEIANDQTGEQAGEQAESEKRWSGQMENPIEEKPKIALTFDDGPSPTYTPMLLDGLKKRKIKATFFLIGESAKAYPEIVERMQAEGHLIGNHTYHHCELTALSTEKGLEEIEQTSRVIEKITGQPVRYVRPPYGEWPDALENRLSMIPVLWSVDSLDWTTENVSEIVDRVVTKTGENDMILMHDCYESSVKAAFQIIDLLQEKGYRFVLAEELLLD